MNAIIKDRTKLLLTVLRFLIPNIYFNFHYLPFRQAWKIPVIFYKPHFGMLKGNVKILGKVRFGMITMGFDNVSIYPNNGIRFQNAGGLIIFQGPCFFGNDTAIAVGKRGKLIVGENIRSSAGLKIACQHSITIGNNVRVGWEVMMVDSDFHKVTYTDGRPSPKGYKPIRIGDYCWLGFRSTIMKGTTIKDHCIVSANSLCNKEYSESYALLAGQPAEIRKTGIYRDLDNDDIVYPELTVEQSSININ